jgi:hypothetical protein
MRRDYEFDVLTLDVSEHADEKLMAFVELESATLSLRKRNDKRLDLATANHL